MLICSREGTLLKEGREFSVNGLGTWEKVLVAGELLGLPRKRTGVRA